MRSNTAYTKFLNTLDDREDQSYELNEGETKPTEVHLRQLKHGYMKDQRELEENYMAHQPPWLLINANFCYNEESPTNNDREKNNSFYSLKKNIKIPKKLTQMGEREW